MNSEFCFYYILLHFLNSIILDGYNVKKYVGVIQFYFETE